MSNYSFLQYLWLKACDPAGPSFAMYDIIHDAKDAAKNVQCIHTSVLAGTISRDCHQNWIMGKH